MPRPTYRTEQVVVDEGSGTHEEILERAKKYVHSPGPQYPFRRPAEIRAAGVFPPHGRPMEVGERGAATPVERRSGAIRDALEKLELGATMTWTWGAQFASRNRVAVELPWPLETNLPALLVHRDDDERRMAQT